MLPIALALAVLGVSFVLFRSQPDTRQAGRREPAPVRVRVEQAPVVRRRVR